MGILGSSILGAKSQAISASISTFLISLAWECPLLPCFLEKWKCVCQCNLVLRNVRRAWSLSFISFRISPIIQGKVYLLFTLNELSFRICFVVFWIVDRNTCQHPHLYQTVFCSSWCSWFSNTHTSLLGIWIYMNSNLSILNADKIMQEWKYMAEWNRHFYLYIYICIYYVYIFYSYFLTLFLHP